MSDLIKQLAAFANTLSNTGEPDGEELLLRAIKHIGELEDGMRIAINHLDNSMKASARQALKQALGEQDT